MLNVPVHWRSLSFLDADPFIAGEHGRPLRILIDEATVETGPALDLLFTFSGRRDAEVISTSVGRRDRVTVGVTRPDDVTDILWSLAGQTWTSGVPAAASWRRSAGITATELNVAEDEAFRVLVLAQAASRSGVDGFVCGSPALAAPMWKNHAKKANLMSSNEAAALLGLYLRAHNDKTVRVVDREATFFEGDRAYRAASVATLPEFRRWLHAAVWRWRETTDSSAFELLRGIEVRFARGLIARDYFNVRVKHPQPLDAWPEALFFFESMLLSLSGVLDAAARLVSIAYLPARRTKEAGFARQGWRRRLRSESADLDDVLAEGGTVLSVTALIATLRNFIHERALSEELHGHESGRLQTVDYGPGALVLRGTEADRLRAAAESLGGLERWGLEDQFDGALLVLPTRYVRALIGAVPAALRAIMDAADERRLATTFDDLVEGDYWVTGQGFESEIRLLFGLDDT